MLKWMRREEGQSYVETALVLPFLILLVMGVLDIGRAFNAYIVVTNAAREGARYGAVHSDNADGIRARVLQETTGTGVTVDAADIAITYPESCGHCGHGGGGKTPGNPIRVTVTHNFQIIASLVLGLDSIPVRAAVEMEIIQ